MKTVRVDADKYEYFYGLDPFSYLEGRLPESCFVLGTVRGEGLSDEPAGLMICEYAADELIIRWLYVDPVQRGRGYGDALLSAAMDGAVMTGKRAVRAMMGSEPERRAICPLETEYFEYHGFMREDNAVDRGEPVMEIFFLRGGNMRILAVDDEDILLTHLAKCIREALPEAEILTFDNAEDVSAMLREEINIAFLDVALGSVSGIDLAKRIKATYPRCDVVFCTGYDEYAAKAFELGASDYLLKPITTDKIHHALSMLRRNGPMRGAERGFYVRCFGEFEAFCDGKPLTSLTRRAKELLAYLVDKQGTVCTSADISTAIFQDSSDSYFRVVKKDLIKVLSDVGQEDVLISDWGKLGIKRDRVRCDYYDYLDGNPGAINQYRGAYMQQYDWAAPTRERLNA